MSQAGAWEVREGAGYVKENGKRPDKDDPDWRGEIKLNGVLYEIAGWAKVQANGKDRINFSIKPARDKAAVPREAPPQREPGQDDGESNIPF